MGDTSVSKCIQNYTTSMQGAVISTSQVEDIGPVTTNWITPHPEFLSKLSSSYNQIIVFLTVSQAVQKTCPTSLNVQYREQDSSEHLLRAI